MNKLITIITPTYNRKEKLLTLYKSLLKQTDYDFNWLVIDDGSTDDTNQEFERFNTSLFDITYIRRKNGGKHRALNFGVNKISTPLAFIVDSDDYLTPNAVSTIKYFYNHIDKQKICGLAFLRKSQNGKYLTNKLVPRNYYRSNYIDCRLNGNIDGDMAEIWVTKILQKYPFPEFDGEKFLSEDVVWIKMAEKYDMYFFNQAIYISDYLPSGITQNRKKYNWNSPLGCMYKGRILLDIPKRLPLKTKIRGACFYNVYGIRAGYSVNQLFEQEKSVWSRICLIPSLMIYCVFKKKYGKE